MIPVAVVEPQLVRAEKVREQVAPPQSLGIETATISGCVACSTLICMLPPPLPHVSEPIRLLRQTVGQIGRDRACVLLVQPMLGHHSREERAIDAARRVVAGRDRQERASVVVESDRVVETGRFGGLLAKAHHAFGTVVKPPGWTEFEYWVMPRQGRKLTTVRALVEREENDA